MPALKLGVLVSGGGTNLQSIIDHIESGYLPAEIAVVISSKEGAYALERAKKHRIPAYVVKRKDFDSQEKYEDEMIELLRRHHVELVVLAGFIKVLSPHFVRAFPNRIMNIHPALIPSFCGKGFYGEKVHEAVLNYGAKITGVTVHFVDEGTDTGPIILQRAVAVEDDDTPDTLAARVLKEEHKIYPEAIKLYAEGRLEIRGRRVIIKSKRRNFND
ncbi:phosphoribosylglycinamide formyltransferase [Biomaibacter acetigenes]|uniref:Phosphoribosylglycinamide formyltransferase n=1 Tax=Biomaibacter acetigenes TaxID=2316383 RepID=A0A3G2R6H8_9FIRM|nr:phosphoribosylglycinamide formyltransferase [Biomaibacter acetigenes]AYO31060.1 phosphoribosylglycinamide formyltransferase [Biomaibacter acetigenes]MDN5313093.1 phosphoribosylglycinamide formyltransferase 1 [Thermoanaerobacteraceae bacterium]